MGDADSPAELDDEDPHSLLFLSCDLVGSTGYKQRKSSEWRQTFLSFYRDFPQEIAEAVEKADLAVSFALWKAVGDELIFTVRVSSELQVAEAVRIWLSAMATYEARLKPESLATKGAAFIATFPGPDSESSIPLDPKQETSDAGVVERNRLALRERDVKKYLFDYFGPSIDTGFRVAGQCTQRHFTLSVEVTWALARARQNNVDAPEIDDVVLLGQPELKGVWGGRNYPLFAVDRHVADPINRAMAHLGSKVLDVGAVADLCEHCVRDPAWPSRLYLPESASASIREKPRDSLSGLEVNYMDGAERVPVGEADSTTTEAPGDAPVN